MTLDTHTELQKEIIDKNSLLCEKCDPLLEMRVLN